MLRDQIIVECGCPRRERRIGLLEAVSELLDGCTGPPQLVKVQQRPIRDFVQDRLETWEVTRDGEDYTRDPDVEAAAHALAVATIQKWDRHVGANAPARGGRAAASTPADGDHVGTRAPAQTEGDRLARFFATSSHDGRG